MIYVLNHFCVFGTRTYNIFTVFKYSINISFRLNYRVCMRYVLVCPILDLNLMNEGKRCKVYPRNFLGEIIHIEPYVRKLVLSLVKL